MNLYKATWPLLTLAFAVGCAARTPVVPHDVPPAFYRALLANDEDHPFETRHSSGATLRILAINSNYDGQQVWWRPDGRVIEGLELSEDERRRFTVSDANSTYYDEGFGVQARHYRVIYTLSGAGNGGRSTSGSAPGEILEGPVYIQGSSSYLLDNDTTLVSTIWTLNESVSSASLSTSVFTGENLRLDYTLSEITYARFQEGDPIISFLVSDGKNRYVQYLGPMITELSIKGKEGNVYTGRLLDETPGRTGVMSLWAMPRRTPTHFQSLQVVVPKYDIITTEAISFSPQPPVSQSAEVVLP